VDVYLNRKRIALDPSASIGKGGEADVFDLHDGRALKLWKAPDHPDYAGLTAEQDAARERLEVHQRKLRDFPRGLPASVVAPVELATDRSGKRLVGYAMELVAGAEVLLRYGEPSFRRSGLSGATAVAALADLHGTVAALHAAGVVIGDFNDLNVLVRAERAFLIDADSFQFGPYLCGVFTERFVDPLLCDPSLAHPLLSRPFNADSDWYAFAVMVLQSLLCVGPYGGIYKPKAPSARIPQAARPLHRVTVFHPEVQYPKPGIPYRVLPDDLLQVMHLVFERDQRGAFPRGLLDELRWTRCPVCGAEHARAVCPGCVLSAPAAVKEIVTVRGEVSCTRVFATAGVIVAAALDEGALRYLVHAGGKYVREDGALVMNGPLDPSLTFALEGPSTIVGRGAEAVVLGPGGAPERFTADGFRGRPVFAASARARTWVHGGRLLRRKAAAARGGGVAAMLEAETVDRVGDVLAGQTLFWVGERFGFGFYRAGTLAVAFVFDAARVGLKDTVKLPFLPGELVDADCALDAERAWVFLAAQHRGKTVHQCVVVRADGTIEASAQAEAGDGTWLGALHGRCAVPGFLLAPTDAGVVRVEPRQGALVSTRSFPDTEPFVDQASRLLAGREGLFVVGAREIRLLRIA
jgi:tRNA A-37 threonylcarbamoyl transferase component Bud32